ncbi:BspA family leucine-rich repeat surface protein [Maribacter algarum]|uniref:BspA family leucine-rich repeat surface protein n=1 Tax=Maribacter algarum (ex Zhang et al. 2020) TaxID=2578118 RepID=A0A5S3QF32_9FLAO|nr:BspA family leucine-rich repeat surface protein [Maribacter algarum]TMM55867.1 BspA family leucine-rich repeat surface protein [Maribacter algarum]
MKNFTFLALFIFLCTANNLEAQENFALRLNTGGATEEYNGVTYEADSYADTGNVLDRPQTGLPEPYQTFRFSRSQQMSYDIPLPDGDYTVNLHFAELWFGATGGGTGGVGSRVFDVNIEGALAEDNLDIFAEVGADAMLVKTHKVTVTGGVLDIDFDSRDAVGGERHPVINAIEILRKQVQENIAVTGFSVWEFWGGDSPYGAYPLNNGDQIGLVNNSRPYVGIGANVNEQVQSVLYEYINEEGIPETKVINQDMGLGVWIEPNTSIGMHTITATPYSEVDQGGEAGPPKTINYEIVDDSTKPRPFITTWKTDNPGISATNEITIPTNPNEVYDYTVDWGDGSSSTGVTGNTSHTYANPGTYTVSINGTFPSIYFRNLELNDFVGDEFKLLTVEQWGDIQWSTMAYAFSGCENLDVRTNDVPNLANVQDLNDMFRRCESLIGNDSFSRWDLSNVTNTKGMFNRARSFNQDISDWNVSNVQYFALMFSQAGDFNQDITGWNVSKGTSMTAMFQLTESFDQDISNWDMSNVTYARSMFWQGGLSVENYDKILIGWSQQNLKPNLDINFSSRYCEGKVARQYIIDNFNWRIRDEGILCKDQDEIWLEAECAEVGSNWNIVNDNNASGGAYLLAPSGNNYYQPPTDEASIIRFKFSANDFLYKIYARVSVPSQEDDSFWIRVNNGEWVRWNLIPGSSELSWHIFHRQENPRNSLAYDLTSGENIIEIGHREDGAGIDKLFVVRADDQNGPDDIGESGANCEPIAFRPFITTWKTDNEGFSEDNQITIPTHPDEVYNYTVDWGDGTSNSAVTGDITHTYATPGTYRISIVGSFPRIYFNDFILSFDTDLNKIISIDQWGDIEWNSMENAFRECRRLDVVAPDAPNLSNVTSVRGMFRDCTQLIGTDAFNSWDVSSVTNMISMFSRAVAFNQDIGDWDVSNVTRMGSMFLNADVFNQDIGDWDVSNVTNMAGMFEEARLFNQDIGDWDVSNVTDMTEMFKLTRQFNSDIGDWDVSNIETLRGTFAGAVAFNQDLSQWDVSNVENMFATFNLASSYDQDLGDWDIRNVSNLGYFLNNTAMSTGNYDNTLRGWANLTGLNSNLNLDAITVSYCNSDNARQKLIEDYGWTINDAGKAADCQPSSNDEFWLEAECANVGGNWSVINNANASGGQYLLPPAGANYNGAPSDPNSIVTFDVDAEAGNYKIYARVSVPSQEDDSFWVRVNGESWLRWNLIPGSADFSWHQVHDRELNTSFLTFDLIDGINTIEIGHREDGAGLDKLYVTRTSNVPTGFGEADETCNSGISGKRAIVETNAAILTPNPVVTSTTLSFEKPVELTTIQVFDVTGRLVHSYNGPEVADEGSYLLQVDDLESGTYFINSVDVKGIKHQKQMVIKK